MDDNTIQQDAQTASVRARMRRVLEQSGAAMARVLAPGQGAPEISADLIKQSQFGLCLRVRVGPDSDLESDVVSGFVKLFDAPDPGTGVEQAFYRERAVLGVMRGSGLVPRLLAACPQRRWLLIEDLTEAATDPAARLDPRDFARRAGDWIARFEARAPARRATGNWLGYVTGLGLTPYLTHIRGAADTLRQIPLCGQVLARNDAALHNYLTGPQDRLLGCDFESATLRPRGWEYVMTWQALLHRYGDQGDQAILALSQGFDRQHQGGLLTDELNAVARILFCARFLQAQAQAQAQAPDPGRRAA